MESWTEYRRTGYPKLMPMAANASGGIVNDAEGARRMPYPTDEYRENRKRRSSSCDIDTRVQD